MTTQTETAYPFTWTEEEVAHNKLQIETAKHNAKHSPSTDPINDWGLLASWAPEGVTPGLVAELLLTHDWTRTPAGRELKLRGAQSLADEVNNGDYDLRGCGLDKLKTTATALLKAAQRRGLPVQDVPMVVQFRGFSVSL